ncbi:MAG TPA: tetratricopeptide repeat protein [Alphaproteobacteria bacterium]|nr:tetratricopeptide repeat protein [Alphaproteobacteria bacterium]
MASMHGKLSAALAAILILAGAGAAPALAMDSGTPAATAPKADDYSEGVKAAHSGNYADAIGHLDKVVASDPKNADAWNMIGYSERKLGKFPESLDAYEKALAIDPNHLGANEYLGELYLQMGDMPKAEERLAKLDKLCGSDCVEYKTLKGLIDAKKKSS